MLNAEKVPDSLKQRDQWVMWKTVERGGKPTKVPLRTDGQPASSTDCSTWAPFSTTLETAQKNSRFDGVGFVFSPDDPYCGIDLDGCRDPETNEIAQWAREIMVSFNTYSEASPSLTGVKLFLRGKLPFDAGKKRPVQAQAMGGKGPAIEAYDQGRYFTVTGKTFKGFPDEPQDRQAELESFCATWFGEQAKTEQKAAEQSSRLSVIERARKYLDTIPGAISGQGGHNAAFKAACVLILGFALTKAEALVLMSEWNARCEPPWNEKELRHKLDSADKQPDARGYLRDAQHPEQVKLPEYRCPAPARPTNEPPARTDPKIVTMAAATQEYLEALAAGKTSLIDLGIGDLDYAIGGGAAFHEMIVVCARPSHGKTAFALQTLDCIASNGMPVAFVTEEMAPIQLGKRTIQFAASTPQEHWSERMTDVHQELADHFESRKQCYIVEGCGTVDRVVLACEKLVAEHGVKAIAIDYAQLLTAPGRDRYQQITQVCQSLRRFANEHDVLLLVLTQSNRAIEGRKMFVPVMADIKETGQFEQDADVILFCVWPHRLDRNKPAKEYQIYVLKNRNRPINEAMVKCQFNPSRQQIVEDPSLIKRVADAMPEQGCEWDPMQEPF